MNRPLRILHVVPYFPPDRIGGVGQVTAHLHANLLAKGRDSIVWTVGRSEDDPRVIRASRSPIGFLFRWRRGLELARGADVVHFQHGEAAALMLALRLAPRRPRLLVTLHSHGLAAGRASKPYWVEGVRIGDGLRSRLKRALRALFHATVDRVARALADRESYICRSVARDFLGSDAADATVVLNGIARQTSDPSPPPDPTELLFVGACSRLKRAHQLPVVLREVCRVMPEARLRIVGARAEEQPELLALFSSMGLADKVHWVRTASSAQVEPYYRAARVLLLLSAYEGLPTALLEAQHAGLPCVATRAGGAAEVIEDGENGFLVDVDQPRQVAEKALQILANPELAKGMSVAARRAAERFGVDRMTTEYEELYRRL